MLCRSTDQPHRMLTSLRLIWTAAELDGGAPSMAGCCTKKVRSQSCRNRFAIPHPIFRLPPPDSHNPDILLDPHVTPARFHMPSDDSMVRPRQIYRHQPFKDPSLTCLWIEAVPNTGSEQTSKIVYFHAQHRIYYHCTGVVS